MIEYFLLIYEFFVTKKIRTILTILFVPILISLLVYYSIYDDEMFISSTNQGNIITLLGILLGFTISLFAILVSSNSSNIRQAKHKMIGRKVLNKDISIYDEMMSGIVYSILLECILLVLNLIIPTIIKRDNQNNIFFVVNIGVLCHIVFVLLRSILSYYFSESKRSDN